MLESFLSATLYPRLGHRVLLREIRPRYLATLPEVDRYNWTAQAFSLALKGLGHQVGIANGNKCYVINVSLDPRVSPEKPFILINGRVRREGEY